MQLKNLSLLILMALALTTTQSAVLRGQEPVVRDKGNPETSSLSLMLSTDKPTYKIKEPIYFTLTLRNVSSSGLWVGKLILFADIPGTFVMAVTDAQGKAIHGDVAYFAGSLDDFKHSNLFDWIRRNRLVLAPGNFLGLTAKFQDYRYDLSAPGKYKLQASYSDIGYREMQEEGASSQKIKKTKEQAKFPLWSGSIQSPEVWIEVVR